MLVSMEFALLREPMPLYSRDSFEVGRVAVYSSGTSYFTGLLTLLITWHLHRQKVVRTLCAILSSSFAAGKMLAVLLESGTVADDYGGDASINMLFRRGFVASALLVTMSAPYVVLRPMHVRTGASGRTKRGWGASGKPAAVNVPQRARIVVVIYCAVVMPLVILVSVPLVLEPLVGLLTGHNKAAYYVTSPRYSEIIGYAASLWGIAVLSMTNYFLPDGGAETWRRVSAILFLTGLFVSFSSPAIPGGKSSWEESNNLFQSVSSLDVEDESNSGGWGLISAFLATLLAVTGPLELRETRDPSGRKDSSQLLRLMIFGMMFGCGLSWFITMQSMSKDIFIPIFVTTLSCMAMSFLGTIATVMGYFLDIKDFIEAEQIANVWGGAFPVFFVIASVSLSAHAYPFGIGGWASTYLSVCGLVAASFTVAMRWRDEKNAVTRGYGNLSCVVSWLCAIIVVYGRFGLASVGVVGITSLAGIPISVLGTFVASLILLLLEGEGNESQRSHRLSSSSSSSKKGTFSGLVLSSLTQSNRIAPLMAGTIGVFLAASEYAILLRGCGLAKLGFLFGADDIIKSHEDVFSHVYGSASRTTGVGGLDDVASMARKSVVHSKTMIAAAKLAGSGLWTSKSLFGPLIHMFGIVVILPSLYYLVRHAWSGKVPSMGRVWCALPLNLVPLLLCRGIPSLSAAATFGIVGGFIQVNVMRNRDFSGL